MSPRQRPLHVYRTTIRSTEIRERLGLEERATMTGWVAAPNATEAAALLGDVGTGDWGARRYGGNGAPPEVAANPGQAYAAADRWHWDRGPVLPITVTRESPRTLALGTSQVTAEKLLADRQAERDAKREREEQWKRERSERRERKAQTARASGETLARMRPALESLGIVPATVKVSPGGLIEMPAEVAERLVALAVEWDRFKGGEIS